MKKIILKSKRNISNIKRRFILIQYFYTYLPHHVLNNDSILGKEGLMTVNVDSCGKKKTEYKTKCINTAGHFSFVIILFVSHCK